MSSDATIVPWINPENFQKVYRNLFSKKISEKRWALDEISVWENLCYPALPVAIEASVFLVRALVQDILYEDGSTLCQEKDIQSLYALALVRFINLILEGDKETTVYRDIAIKHNLPPWIVDIRHDATHSHCPSLPILRIGAEKALEYLEETFWKKASVRIVPYKKPVNPNRELLENLLSNYRAAVFQTMNENKDLKDIRYDSFPMVNSVVKKLRYFAQNNHQLFVEILVQPSVFLNTSDLTRLLCNKGRTFLEEEGETVLPEELDHFWEPIVEVLHGSRLLQTFMEYLLLNLHTCAIKLCQKVAIAWVMEILLSMNKLVKSRLGRMYAKKPWKVNYMRLLNACMKSISEYSHLLLDYLVHRIDQGKNREQYKELFCLLAMRQGLCVDEKFREQAKARKSDGKELVFTVDDLQEDLEEMKAKNKPWRNAFSQTPSNMDFSNVPIGTILNPVIIAIPESDSHDSMEVETMEITVDRNGTDREGALEETNSDDNSFPETISVGTVRMLYRKRQ